MFLGYEPAWQDIFGTESGDLREMLREQIDQCKGVVQLVGSCYGAEPPTVDGEFGRVSYTQYEALYARKRGKKVWYLFIDENFPIDAHEPEPEELRNLQAAYRKRLQADTHIFHPLTSREGLEAGVLKLRDDLTRLRRGRETVGRIRCDLAFDQRRPGRGDSSRSTPHREGSWRSETRDGGDDIRAGQASARDRRLSKSGSTSARGPIERRSNVGARSSLR